MASKDAKDQIANLAVLAARLDTLIELANEADDGHVLIKLTTEEAGLIRGSLVIAAKHLTELVLTKAGLEGLRHGLGEIKE